MPIDAETEDIGAYNKRHIVYGANKDGLPAWRCLSCGMGGQDIEPQPQDFPKGQGMLFGEITKVPKTYSSDLIVETHMLDCQGSNELGAMREDLNILINGYVEFAGTQWTSELNELLFNRQGIWKILAQQLGWPVGVDGIDGWISYEEAEHMYNSLDRLRS